MDKESDLRAGKGVTVPSSTARFASIWLARFLFFFSLTLFFFLLVSLSLSKKTPPSLSLSGRNDGGQLGVGPDAVVPKLSHPRGMRRWAALALSPGPGAPSAAAASPSVSASSTSTSAGAAGAATAPPPPPTTPTGHAAGVDGSGDVYTWGRNDHGQLGVPPGQNQKREAPARMSILKGWDVRAVACG